MAKKDWTKLLWRSDRPWWKNLLFDSWYTFFVFCTILLLVYGYKHDTAQCWDAYEDPCKFCLVEEWGGAPVSEIEANITFPVEAEGGGVDGFFSPVG